MKIKVKKGGIRLGTWNHRLILHNTTSDPEYMRVHEVHYDELGFAMAWDEDGARVDGDGIEQVCETLERIRRAIERPVLVIMKLDDGHEVLVERDTGERAHNVPLDELPDAERRELENMASTVVAATRKKGRR